MQDDSGFKAADKNKFALPTDTQGAATASRSSSFAKGEVVDTQEPVIVDIGITTEFNPAAKGATALSLPRAEPDDILTKDAKIKDSTTQSLDA